MNQKFIQMRDNWPMALRPFLMAMPKGAELHTHLTGAIYAEDYIDFASNATLYSTNSTLFWDMKKQKFVGRPTGVATIIPASELINHPDEYEAVVNALSDRDWKPDPRLWGHDHFFAAFGKFGDAKSNTGALLARVADRAYDQQLMYQEIMLSLYPDKLDRYTSNSTREDDSVPAMYNSLVASGLLRAAQPGGEVQTWLTGVLAAKARMVERGRGVETRFINQVGRTGKPNSVFTQLLFACELCRRDARVVALNLVAPEDNPRAVRDYAKHMQMIQWLKAKPEYANVNVTLHAGELYLGLVPPEALCDHIAQAVRVAGAQRIGHGADIICETDAYNLLQQMAQRRILVEICLSSNAQILHLEGRDHPLALYMNQGVPVSLNTDDEGIERIDLTNEFWRAAVEHKLDYLKLKNLARNSLEYSFLPGNSLWQNPVDFTLVPACQGSFQSRQCHDYVAANLKAMKQMVLETLFNGFEDAPPYLHGLN
ncbi:adenosine deaminase family protein [Desulfocurvus sp. DL9XJH121]